ncbi:MAG: sensor histidine kinase [Acidimicrobiia bacterium]
MPQSSNDRSQTGHHDEFGVTPNDTSEQVERDRRFTANIAHELRTPLTAMVSATDVIRMRRAELSERVGVAFDVLDTQIHRLHQMVEDLLELGRIDVRAAELRMEPVHLPDVVAAVAREFGYGDVPVQVDGTPSPVSIDRRRFERILINLLDNARVHGGGACRVALEFGRMDVSLAVEDAGRGIDETSRELIFERFARSRTSIHQSHGTGLGLAIVSEHARAHGGTTRAEERIGGGARVVVVIPFGQREA